MSDTERLDWMIANHASFGSVGTLVGTDPVKWENRIFARRPCAFGYEWHCHDGEDARAAIDAGMAAPPCAPSRKHGCTQSNTIRDADETPMETLRHRVEILTDALYARAPGYADLRAALKRQFDAAPILSPASSAALDMLDALDRLIAEPVA